MNISKKPFHYQHLDEKDIWEVWGAQLDCLSFCRNFLHFAVIRARWTQTDHQVVNYLAQSIDGALNLCLWLMTHWICALTAYLTVGATETTREIALISPHWPFCLVRSSTMLDALYLPEFCGPLLIEFWCHYLWFPCSSVTLLFVACLL